MALHHLNQIIGKPHSIFIPKTRLAKSIFCCSKYHSIFSTQSHQPEVIFKSCCKINQRQNPIISSITEMFPFCGQKLPSYPVFLICVRASSPVTLIPPGGGLQNPPAGFVKKFLPSSVLFSQMLNQCSFSITKPLLWGRTEHVEEHPENSSVAVHTNRNTYSVYCPIRVRNRRILHKTSCAVEKTPGTKLCSTNYSISYNKHIYFHKQLCASFCGTQSNKTPCCDQQQAPAHRGHLKISLSSFIFPVPCQLFLCITISCKFALLGDCFYFIGSASVTHFHLKIFPSEASLHAVPL